MRVSCRPLPTIFIIIIVVNVRLISLAKLVKRIAADDYFDPPPSSNRNYNIVNHSRNFISERAINLINVICCCPLILIKLVSEKQ